MSGAWWKAVSQRSSLQQVWLWVTLGEVWMAKFKFITTHLKAKWSHWVIKPCLIPDVGSNILCILKQDEDFHIDNCARFFPLFSLILHGLFCSAALLFSIALCLCFSSSRIFPVIYKDHLLPQCSWMSLHLPDLSPPETTSTFKLQLKKVLSVSATTSLLRALSSFMSVWDVFVEHSIFTERCRINSTHHQMRQFNLRLLLIIPFI